MSSVLCSLSQFVHLLGFVMFSGAADQSALHESIAQSINWAAGRLTCPSTQFLRFKYASFASVCNSQLMLLLSASFAAFISQAKCWINVETQG